MSGIIDYLTICLFGVWGEAPSKLILESEELQKFDKAFGLNKNILGVKLCGSGGGGYFFALCDKGFAAPVINGVSPIYVTISESGVSGVRV